MSIFNLLRALLTTAPESVLAGTLQLKFWMVVLHFLDNLPGKVRRTWGADGGPMLGIGPYYPSVGVADSSPDFIRQRRMRGGMEAGAWPSGA